MTKLLFGLAAVSLAATLFCFWGGMLAHSDPECLAILPIVGVLTGVFLTGGLVLTQLSDWMDALEADVRNISRGQSG